MSLLVVLRPGVLVVPREDGLLVRGPAGERVAGTTALARVWPRLRPGLQAGAELRTVPAPLRQLLVDAGAVTVVGSALVASPTRWHRYAMAWARDPQAAVDAVTGTSLTARAGTVEAGALRRTAAVWGLPAPALVETAGCRLRVRRSGTDADVVVRWHDPGTLLVTTALPEDADRPQDPDDLGDAAPPARALAAGAALLVALRQAAGPDGWAAFSPPLLVDVHTHTVRDAEGRSSR
jgi:hypothetical protein